MVTPELVAQLKQVNVSQDKDKTTERVRDAFFPASRKDKHDIEKLSGQKRTSIYRVAKTGSISAKIALPMAEILNISPYWLTGESDEAEPCSDALVLKFLDDRGYKLEKVAKPPRKQRAQKPEPVSEPAPAPAPDENILSVTVSLSNTPKMRQAVENLDAESAGQLLQALHLRAKAGGNAEQLWDFVKLCLLS
ncbi:MAG: hypothetical protein LBR76_03810 [Oscillospiraceae bacterium]|jgi:hypothetical protein|nr:hypothetical protein [Oscillospiraceae bacterium]